MLTQVVRCIQGAIFIHLLSCITVSYTHLPMILQSLAPGMLYTPTAAYNYITVADKVTMPAGGGTTCRFMRPRALQPPTVQLGNSGIDPPAQVPQRDIIDAQMAWFGTGKEVHSYKIAA